MNELNIVGVMSGTSLDGLDIAHCSFKKTESGYEGTINFGITVPYSNEWLEKLKRAHKLSGSELIALHNSYGKFIGLEVSKALCIHMVETDYIASHGHTLFHQPDNQLTFQLGNGAYIRATSGFPVVSDFRTLDVALEGEGAPLVPIGDELLFGNYDACLNLGGFSNVSFNNNQDRIAYDICPVNMALNKLALENGMSYDKDGKLSKRGESIPEMLTSLNNLAYYNLIAPKSLSREWFANNFWPVVEKYRSEHEVKDIQKTLYEHIIFQLVQHLDSHKEVLVTGGGAHNSLLTKQLKNKLKNTKLILPSKEMIDFKEAYIFAFLGFLRIRNEINIYKTYTNARENSISGIIWK